MFLHIPLPVFLGTLQTLRKPCKMIVVFIVRMSFFSNSGCQQSQKKFFSILSSSYSGVWNSDVVFDYICFVCLIPPLRPSSMIFFPLFFGSCLCIYGGWVDSDSRGMRWDEMRWVVCSYGWMDGCALDEGSREKERKGGKACMYVPHMRLEDDGGGGRGCGSTTTTAAAAAAVWSYLGSRRGLS